MLNVCETFNMPQTSIYKGFEVCYVNRLNLLAIFLFKMEVGLMVGIVVGMVGLIAKNFFQQNLDVSKIITIFANAIRKESNAMYNS